jgi:hypothetical protein
MLQVAEDVLERDPLRLADAQRVLDDPFARIARGAAAVHALTRMRHRSIAPWAERLAVLVEELAAAALGTGRLPRPGTVAGAIGDIPTDEGLLSAVTRPPTCFRDLDQHPDDLRELARRIAARRPPLPVVVAGVRTSGSYLAPLLAAALRAEGMAATALTLRPYVRPGRAKLRRLREAATVVVTDDPPSSGGSIGAVADLAGRGGARVLLALQMLADAPELPARLERYETVLLPWEAPSSKRSRRWPGNRSPRSSGSRTRRPPAGRTTVRASASTRPTARHAM